MTELDPRFDARFQRGYVPGSGEEDPRADASPAPAEHAAVAPRVPESAAADPVPPAPGVESDAHAQPRADAADAGRAELAPSDATGPVRRWLWAAFAFCGAVVGGGLAGVWATAYRDGTYFSGQYQPTAWEELRWLISGVLVEVGLLGAGAIAVWLGLRLASRGGRVLSPPVIGLGIGAAVALLLVLWTGSSPTLNILYASDPLSWSDDERQEAALAQFRTVLAPIAVRVGVFAVLGILAVGARAAMATPAAPASAGNADGERGGIDAEVR